MIPYLQLTDMDINLIISMQTAELAISVSLLGMLTNEISKRNKTDVLVGKIKSFLENKLRAVLD